MTDEYHLAKIYSLLKTYDHPRHSGTPTPPEDDNTSWSTVVQYQLDNIYYPSEWLNAEESANQIAWIVGLLEMVVGETRSNELWEQAQSDPNHVHLMVSVSEVSENLSDEGLP